MTMKRILLKWRANHSLNKYSCIEYNQDLGESQGFIYPINWEEVCHVKCEWVP